MILLQGLHFMIRQDKQKGPVIFIGRERVPFSMYPTRRRLRSGVGRCDAGFPPADA